MMDEYVRFLGVRLQSPLSRENLLASIFLQARKGKFGFLVTPNVDHVVRLSAPGQEALREIYERADISVCDSRVIASLASLLGVGIDVYPGSDIVKDMLHHPAVDEWEIGVLGPSHEDFLVLSQRFPTLQLVFFPSPPAMEVGSSAFAQCAQEVVYGQWDILLVCLGFPKQEYFVDAIRSGGRRYGLALCVGASVDFLTGKQKRAPLILQRLSLEWAYRLVGSPRRLWRRYILGLPALAWLYFRMELCPRLLGREQRR